jgi:hypothetical protein
MMRGIKRDIDWVQYDALMAEHGSRRKVAEQMGLSESTLRSAEKSRRALIPIAPPAFERDGGVQELTTTALSRDERSALEVYERTIEAGLQTFIEVGKALLAIRDGKLYRADYTTFEEYCQHRWHVSRPYAYQLMDASVVVKNVSAMADVVPTNEAQARSLTRLDPEAQQQVWRKVVDTAPARGITAAHVSKTVKARTVRTTPTTSAREMSAIADNALNQTPGQPAPTNTAPLDVQGRKSRPQRWHAALDELRALQAEYEFWLENLPDGLRDSPTAEMLETICSLDLDELDVELPRGFGRD